MLRWSIARVWRYAIAVLCAAGGILCCLPDDFRFGLDRNFAVAMAIAFDGALAGTLWSQSMSAAARLRPAAVGTAVCPRGHPVAGVGILCREPGCRSFILFDVEFFQPRRIAAFVLVMMLVLSSMTVLILSGMTNKIWPLYVFASLCLFLLYATIFSRGVMLAPAAWILSLVAVVWLLWQVIGRRALGDERLTEVAGGYVSPVAWILLTAYLYYVVSKRSLGLIRKPSAYFVTTGLFTFGFWGVWLVLLEADLVTNITYRLAIGFGLLIPLVSFGVLAMQAPAQTLTAPDPRQPVTDERRWNLSALWLVVVACYLVLIEPLVQALSFVLGHLLPLAVGKDQLPDVTVDWLGDVGWRALATSVLLMLAITLVAVRSLLEVTAKEAELSRFWEPETSTRGGQQTYEDTGDREAVTDLAESLRDTALHNFRETGYAGTFYGQIALQFFSNVFRMARYVLSIAFPIAIFTALSLLIVLVISVFQDYRSHGPFFAPISLWGTGLTTLIVAVIVCGLAFEFAPYQKRGAGRAMVESGAASLLSGLLYFLVSLVSVALLPLWLYPRESSAQLGGFVPGRLFFTNLSISMGILALLVVLTLLFRGRLIQREPEPGGIRLFDYSVSVATFVLLLLGIAAFYTALPPIQAAARYVSSSHQTSADSALRGQVPATLLSSCSRDRMMLDGYQAGLACEYDEIKITYHLFAAEGQLTQWYEQTLAHRDIPTGIGTCDRSDAAEGVYTSDIGRGRIACYNDRGGSWLIWTELGSRTLGIARSSQHSLPDLYARWTSRSFG